RRTDSGDEKRCFRRLSSILAGMEGLLRPTPRSPALTHSLQRRQHMREVVIAGYLRTAQSRCRPRDPARDVFGRIRADELLAKLLPELAKRTGIQPEEIEDFIVGCATAVG